MKKEYINMLEKLKNELLTQPTDGNCNPRYWGIKQLRREHGINPEYADGWEVYDGENCEIVGKPDDIQSVIDEMVSTYEVDDTEFENHRGDYDYIDISDISDVVLRINQIIRKRAGESIDSARTPFDIVYYKDHYTVSEDALFLTKKACEEHIAKYGHNYNNPHTYVMTAQRCPEYEKLLEIITETDWAGQAGDYDTQVCTAVQKDPYKFVDILNELADRANEKGDREYEPAIREAACVIANLLGKVSK